MTDKENSCVETIEKDEKKPIVNNNVGRYFDSNTHTVFDDIVSTASDDVFKLTLSSPSLSSSSSSSSSPSTTQIAVGGNDGICELTPMSEMLSGEFLKNDNVFNAERSMDSSSRDFHRDAWIPCEHTRKVLRSIATSTPGNSFPDRENLTMPGLTLQGDMIDTAREAAIHYLGEDENIHRNILTVGDVTQDERGLRNLIQAGCYRAAINLSGRLLAIYGQGYGKINHPSKHTPHSLQLWYTRLSLLVKLRQIEVVEAESQPFGNLDKPDMYFIFYPELYGTRHGSMASFAFRLLLAEISSYCGKRKETIDNLYKLLATVNQIIKNLEMGLSEEGGTAKFNTTEREDSIKLWNGRRSRIFISIVNCALMMKNYILAIDVLEDLYKSKNWTEEQLEILKSAIGRVHLFLGDVSAAEKIFASIKNNTKSSSSARELIDRGLMAVAQNAFQEAYTCFKNASATDPTNIMLINNMAVCLLYNGQLKAAVQLLENNVTRNPVKNLHESVVLNMSTLYELHTTHSKQSKLQLLRQINRYKGDATDISCLKLT